MTTIDQKTIPVDTALYRLVSIAVEHHADPVRNRTHQASALYLVNEIIMDVLEVDVTGGRSVPTFVEAVVEAVRANPVPRCQYRSPVWNDWRGTVTVEVMRRLGRW